LEGLNLQRIHSGIILLKLRQILRRTNILNTGLLLLLAFFCWLMASITLTYIPYNTDVGFLRIKQQYIHIDHWRTAFFIHVYASIWILLAGFTQFSRKLQRQRPQLHRAMGYIYTIDVLLITGPAGLLMGFYANGGPSSRIAFVTLAILWIFCTAMALYKARKKDFKAHRNYMIRSYALTLSAITLRAWKYGISNSVELPPMDVYRTVAWLGWTVNLLIAEIIIYRLKNRAVNIVRRPAGS
jgi:uncharacterized membrane protein